MTRLTVAARLAGLLKLEDARRNLEKLNFTLVSSRMMYLIEPATPATVGLGHLAPQSRATNISFDLATAYQ